MEASVACDTYKDYLVLGRTGMGKSTTADRLLVANSVVGAVDVTPVDKGGSDGNTQLDNIKIWRLSRLSRRSVDYVTERVKRFLENGANFAATIISKNKSSTDSITNDCTLLSNEKTKIRVLDVPGFYSSLSSQQVAALELQVANQSNLGIMRQILRIQAIKKLRFHRIIYFLPYRGVCERADKSFQEEIEVMYHYFGRLIFDSMIVIATERSRRSKLDAINYEEIEENRVTLNRTFQCALAKPDQNPDEVQDIPQPPIIYLSLEESNSDVLRRLQETKVARMDGLQLHFHENTCAQCSLKFSLYKTPTGFEPVVSIQESDGRLSPYDQSQCHPLIIPKYSKVEKFFGGVAYIVLLGIPKLAGNPWPGWFNRDEECAKCERPPGSPGCTLLGEEWVVAGNKIKVDHKSELDKVVEV